MAPPVRGFTLVEVLVALVIAGLALGLLFRGGIDGLASTRVAARVEEATARAQSRLTASCHGARLAPGTQSGDDGGGFAWRTQVQVAGDTTVPRGNDDDPKPPLRATLYAVRVTVGWGGGARMREVSLATSCLAVAPGKPA
jgi:general secretion pathway protein I